MQDQKRFEVEYLPDGSPNFFKGKGVSAAFYYFVLDEMGERWLAKGLIEAEIVDNLYYFNEKKALSSLYKEIIANKLYSQFGIPAARLETASLPLHFQEGNVWEEITKYTWPWLKKLPCILSRFLDHFNDYGYLPNLKTDKPYFEFLIDDQTFPEVGLGRVLAVTQWIRDIDAIGGSGGNVGYRLRQHTDKGLLVETCKIDPGGAFFEFEKPQNNEVNPVIQLAQQGGQEIYTQWQDWPQQTQAEYWETIKAIIDLPESKLIEIFEKTDPQKHYQNYDLCLTRLKARQAHLRVWYQEYENTIQNKPQKVIELPDLTLMQSDDPIIRLETNQQLMLSSNSVQQAFHFYLPPFVLIDAHMSLDTRREWEEELIRFTKNPQKKCLLLLGPAGAGKSIESLRCIRFAQTAGFMPLRVELKRFTGKTVGHCVINTLKDDYQLSDIQIDHLKTQPMLIILDGYDEIAGRPRINLYDSNDLVEWENSKVLITCRSQYFTREMRMDFIPNGNAQGLQEWHLAPLDENQIQDYLRRYHEEHPEFELDAFLDYLKNHHETKALLNTPLMLKLLVEAWPYLSRENKPLTRYDLYEAFFKSWETLQEVRAIQQLGKFEKLIPIFRQFSEDLAWILYAHERESVNYTGEQADPIWDRFFTDKDPEVIKARLGCPLTRKGTAYSFLHKSFADHLVARQLGKSLREDPFEICLQKWNQRFLVDERAILTILAEKLDTLPKQQSPQAKRLFKLIKASKNKPENGVAASNAISVLNHANVMLIRKDFRTIHIPRADLSLSCCVGSNFEGANLQEVNLQQADLREVNFTHANLTDVIFGERAYMKFNKSVSSLGSFAFSGDGKWLVAAVGNTIEVCEWETGECRHTLNEHTDEVTSFMFRDRLIVSGSKDNTVRVWDVETGKCRHTLNEHIDEVTSVTLCDELIVSGSKDNTVRVWDVQNGDCRHILRGHTDCVNRVTLQDGFIVSVSKDNTVRIWDVKTGDCLHILQGHTSTITSVTLCDGLIVSGSWDTTVRVWDVKTGDCRHTLNGHTREVRKVILCDGLIVSASNDNTVRIWDVKTGDCRHILQGHTNSVTSVALRDGYIFSGSLDKTVRVWDVETGHCRHILQGHTEYVMSVVPLHDGLIVSGSKDNTVRVWNVETSDCRHTFNGHTDEIMSVTLCDGLIVSVDQDNTVCVWDVETGEFRHTFNGHTDKVMSVTLQDRLIVSENWNNTVRVWDIETGGCRHTFNGHEDLVNSVALCDGLIVSGSGGYLDRNIDNTVRVWDVQTGDCRHILRGHTNRVNSVALRDGVIVSGSGDNTVRVWDVETGHCRHILQGHTFDVTSVTLCDGLIVSGSWDKTVRVWDVQTGRCLHILQGHTCPVTSVALCDGVIVSSGDNSLYDSDNNVRVWNVQTGNCLQVIDCAFHVRSVALSKNGELIIGMNKSIQYYQRNSKGLFQLVWSNSTSETLQLRCALIDEAIGLSPNNLALMKQRGAIDKQIIEFIEEPIKLETIIYIPTSTSHVPYSPTFFTPLVDVSISANNKLSLEKEKIELSENKAPNMNETFSIQPQNGFNQRIARLAQALKVKTEKSLAPLLANLLLKLAGIEHPILQVRCSAGDKDILCLEFQITAAELSQCKQYYKRVCPELIISSEKIHQGVFNIVINLTILEAQLLEKLIRCYQEMEAQKRLFSMSSN